MLKQYFRHRPALLFLVDGIGALFSAFLLGVVLIEYQSVIGIPPSSLFFLAVFPVLFFLYDGYCLIQKPFRIGTFLKGIAVMNLMYIILSLSVVIYHARTISLLGWGYFGMEVMIVAFLARLEFILAQTLPS